MVLNPAEKANQIIYRNTAHYNRNALNQTVTYQQVLDEGWVLMSEEDSKCHVIGASNENNMKFVSPDGDEAVFYENGVLVSDPVNLGTYNYTPKDESMAGHAIDDVLPWLCYGNSQDDPTTPLERFGTLLGLDFLDFDGKLAKPIR